MYVCSKNSILQVVNVHKTDGCQTSGENPDPTPCSAGSDLGLQSLLSAQYLEINMVVYLFFLKENVAQT